MSNWISVEERLPMDNQNVFAYTKGGEYIIVPGSVISMVNSYDNGVDPFYTHWMLPEPPNKN